MFLEQHPAPSHFIRIENINTVYLNDKNKSTVVPYEIPQVDHLSTIYLVQFMCYNSCVGGGKKPIEIIATLEKEYYYLLFILYNYHFISEFILLIF